MKISMLYVCSLVIIVVNSYVTGYHSLLPLSQYCFHTMADYRSKGSGKPETKEDDSLYIYIIFSVISQTRNNSPENEIE